jgi:hypothetical protein
MEAYGWAAAIVSGIGAASWIAVTALRKVPLVCREATKAIKSVRALRDEIRESKRPAISESIDE